MVEKLSIETKAEICTHFKNRRSQVEIAKTYGVSQSTESKTTKKNKKRKTYARKLRSVEDLLFLKRT